MDSFEKYKPEIATGVVAVAIGYLSKSMLKMEPINVDSFGKALGAFVVVAGSGIGYKYLMAMETRR